MQALGRHALRPRCTSVRVHHRSAIAVAPARRDVRVSFFNFGKSNSGAAAPVGGRGDYTYEDCEEYFNYMVRGAVPQASYHPSCSHAWRRPSTLSSEVRERTPYPCTCWSGNLGCWGLYGPDGGIAQGQATDRCHLAVRRWRERLEQDRWEFQPWGVTVDSSISLWIIMLHMICLFGFILWF